MFIQIRPNFKLISSEFPARKIMKIAKYAWSSFWISIYSYFSSKPFVFRLETLLTQDALITILEFIYGALNHGNKCAALFFDNY